MKKIVLAIILLNCVAPYAWSAEVNAASQRADASTDTTRMEDKYFFATVPYLFFRPDLTNYLEGVPQAVIENWRQKVEESSICPNNKVLHSSESCKYWQSLPLGKDELQYLKIQPGFSVVGFKDFKEIYRGQLSSLSYDKVYMQQMDMYFLFMHLARNPSEDAAVYVIAPSSNDLNNIREFSNQELKKVISKEKLHKYSLLISQYYESHPELSLSSLLPEIPDEIRAGLSSGLVGEDLSSLDRRRQTQVLEQALMVNAWQIEMDNGRELILVDYRTKYVNSNRVCLIKNNQISWFVNFMSMAEAVYRWGDKLSLKIAVCGDVCTIYWLIGDGDNWQQTEIYYSGDG